MARLLLYRGLEDFILVYPLYAVLFRDHGLGAGEISGLLALWSVTALVTEVPSGALADRCSRRVLLALAQILTAAGFGAWLLAPGPAGFAVGFVLWGAGGSLVSGTYEALVYDELAAVGQAQRYVGVVGRAEAVSLAAVAAATLLAAPAVLLGYDAVLAAGIAASLAAGAVALTLPARAVRAEVAERAYLATLREGVRLAVRTPALARLLCLGAAAGGLYGAIEEYIPLVVADEGFTRPLVPLVVGVTMTAALLAGWTAERFAGWSLRALALLLVASGGLLAAAGTGAGVVAVALLTLYTYAAKLLAVLADGRLQHAVGDGPRATITSVGGLGMEAVAVLTYLGYGFAAELAGTAGALVLAGAVTAACGLLALALRERGT